MVRNHNKSFKVKMDTFDRWITKKNSMMNVLEKTSSNLAFWLNQNDWAMSVNICLNIALY